MTLENQSRPGRGGSETSIATDADLIVGTFAVIKAACDAYMVLLVTPRDKILRRPYLSLHSAQQALQRAQDRGQQAYLVLCRLQPITADLDGRES